MNRLSLALTVLGALFLCACTSVQSSGSSGTTTVRIATDAQGRVATVTILKSAGSAELDRATVGYVKKTWHGPPNSSREVTMEYRVQ